MASQKNHFLSTGMTPRSWRMLSYICVGTTIYGMVLLTETLQTYKLNRIDQQLDQYNRQIALENIDDSKSSEISTAPNPSLPQ
ncbi:MAG: hypothetical protein HYT97_04665 [Elusimicrobia bacterium]|nr:hypothetical protein [Elusimicrobiota bacterium]